MRVLCLRHVICTCVCIFSTPTPGCVFVGQKSQKNFFLRVRVHFFFFFFFGGRVSYLPETCLASLSSLSANPKDPSFSVPSASVFFFMWGSGDRIQVLMLTRQAISSAFSIVFETSSTPPGSLSLLTLTTNTQPRSYRGHLFHDKPSRRSKVTQTGLLSSTGLQSQEQ